MSNWYDKIDDNEMIQVPAIKLKAISQTSHNVSAAIDIARDRQSDFKLNSLLTLLGEAAYGIGMMSDDIMRDFYDGLKK